MSRGGGGGSHSSHSSSSHGGGSSSMHSSSGGHSRGYSSSSRSSSRGSSRSSSSYRGGYRGGPRYHTHYYYGGRPYVRTVYTRPFGCASVLLIFVMALILIFACRACVMDGSTSTGGIQKSTLERHQLAGNLCEEIDDWYEDNMSERWIYNSSELIEGLEHFYDVTGVQPYVVIVERLNGVNGCPTDSEFTNFLKGVYDDKMPDGGHLVIGVFDNSNIVSGDYDWGFGCYAGKDAESVMDPEAREILIDYLELYYTQDSLSDEAFLAKAISETGDKIMTVDKVQSSNVKTIIIVLSCVAVVALVVWFVLRRKKIAAEKAQADAEILKTDLGSSSDSDPLKDKYNVK